jgi:hypothetical protein
MSITNETVAHNWFYGLDANKQAKNLFWESLSMSGDGERERRLYSYGHHFIVARRLWVGSELVVLFNSDTYSSTTQRHCSYARQAVPADTTSFKVPYPCANMKRSHIVNYEWMLEQAAEALGKAKRARKHGDYWLNIYANYIESANRYTSIFKLGRHQKAMPAEVAELRAAAAARKAAAEAALVAANADKVARWQAGQVVHLPYGLPVMLRLSKQAERWVVQTSRGITVDILTALSACLVARRAADAEYIAGLKARALKFSHFTFHGVSGDGQALVIGCHTIPLSEFEALSDSVQRLAATQPELERIVESPSFAVLFSKCTCYSSGSCKVHQQPCLIKQPR